MTIEQLTQQYDNPGNVRVPPEVTIVMLRNGTFWNGSIGAPLSAAPASASLSAGVASQLFAGDPSRGGGRLLNYGPSPVYLSPTDPPASGPPSEFVPPGTMDQAGNVWPGQFTFDYAPTSACFAISAEDADIAVFVW